jgi:hypothetical protein
MRRRRRSPKVNLPDLFSPPPMIPIWRSLAPQIQQQIRPLLTKLLQSGCLHLGPQTPPKEVSNE